VDRHQVRLTFITPLDSQALQPTQRSSAWNRVVLAFVPALPAVARIALLWC
jgi:hypothetical protein